MLLCIDQRNNQIPTKYTSNGQTNITKTFATEPNLRPSGKQMVNQSSSVVLFKRMSFIFLSFLPTR